METRGKKRLEEAEHREMSDEETEETQEIEKMKKETSQLQRLIQLISEQTSKIEEKIDEQSRKLEQKLDEQTRRLEEFELKFEIKLQTTRGEIKEEVKRDVENMIEKKTQGLEKQIDQQEENLEKTRQEFGVYLNHIKKQSNEGLESLEEKIRVNKEKLQKLDEKIGNESIKCEKKLQEIGEFSRNSEQKFQEKLQLQFEVRRKELQDQILRQEKQLQKLIARGNDNRTIPANIGDNKCNFNGDVKLQHPIPFVRFLRNKEPCFITFIEFKEFIRNQLIEKAALWFTNIEWELESYEDFERRFLSFFWGRVQQDKVIDELYNGKYEHRRGLSASWYAMQIYSSAKYLDANFPEENLVGMLIKHFENYLGDALMFLEFRKMEQLCQWLMKNEEKLQNYNNNRYNRLGQAHNGNSPINNNRNYFNNNYRQNKNRDYTNQNFNNRNQNDNKNNVNYNNHNNRYYNNNNWENNRYNHNNGNWQRDKRETFNRENQNDRSRGYNRQRSPRRDRSMSEESQDRQGQNRRMNHIQTRQNEQEVHRTHDTTEEAGTSQNFQ